MERPKLIKNMSDQLIGLYVLYDVVLEEAGPVFQSKTDLVASRETVRIMLSNKHVYPEDYKLYKIADFDNQNLLIEPCKREINYLTSYYDKIDAMAELKITEIEGKEVKNG